MAYEVTPPSIGATRRKHNDHNGSVRHVRAIGLHDSIMSVHLREGLFSSVLAERSFMTARAKGMGVAEERISLRGIKF